MAIGPVDFSSRDYASVREDLIAAIPTLIPEWTSRSPSDFGMAMIEMMAYVADGLHYYIDRLVNEAFIGTAVQRSSVLALAEMLGYRPVGRSAASASVSFTAASSNSSTITIPAGTQVSTVGSSTQTAIVFETATDLSVAPGATQSVTANQGVTRNEDTDSSPVGIGTGLIDQEFTLYYTPVVDGSITLYVDDDGSGPALGNVWRFIEHLLDAQPGERVFTTTTDEDEVVHILFGDGANGGIPVLGSIISATYRQGGGVIGNVGANTITQAVGPLAGITVINNAAQATGGADQESLASIRRSAPRSLTALNRAVTLKDYANLAVQVPGVAIAEASGTPVNVQLYVVPVGGGNPSSDLQNTITNFFVDKQRVDATLTISNPTYVPINVTVNPLNVLPNFSQTAVKLRVADAINQIFALDNVDFSIRVTLSSIYQALQAIEGVDYGVVTVLSRTGSGLADVQMASYEIPTAGTVTITASGGLAGS